MVDTQLLHLSVGGLRRLRLLLSSGNRHFTAARHTAPFSGCCFRRATETRTPTPAVHSSFRSLNKQVSFFCPSIRCLSTPPRSVDGNLVYTGSLGTAVRGVKMFSYGTSGASLFLMPQILLKTGLGVKSFALQVAFCGMIGFFTFLTPVLLHLITRGYVVRLYHDADRDVYTAVTYSVFLTERRSVFHQNQVRIPSVSRMFTTFYAGREALLVNPDLFPVPHDYNHLMGYDKPFSFSTDDLEGDQS